MTGTNVFIRGTTQFRAETPATLVFKTKRHFYFNFSSHQQPVLTHSWTSQHRHFL